MSNFIKSTCSLIILSKEVTCICSFPILLIQDEASSNSKFNVVSDLYIPIGK